MHPTRLCGVLVLFAACGPGPRETTADAPPVLGADARVDASTISDPCLAAAEQRSYIGCSYWAVDLENAIEVWGPTAAGGDCSAFGTEATLLAAVDVCVASDGTFAGRCDPGGGCAAAGATYSCQTHDACGLDAQHSVFAIVVANVDPATAASVTIEDATGITSTVVVPAGATAEIAPQQLGFPDRSISAPGVTASAYHLTSTLPVVAYQFNPLDNVGVFSNDASLLLPEQTFDLSYRALSYQNLVRRPATDDWRGYVTVVAPADGITVQVTPTTDVLAGAGTGGPIAAGETRSIPLQRFETLQLEAATGDLTGTRIDSDRPVGAFSGHEAAVIADPFPFRNPCCADHLEEQLLPTATWGRTYAIARVRERENLISDYVRVLALVPNTIVSIAPDLGPYSTCGGVLLAAGGFCDVYIHEDIELHTNQPVLVAHYLVSGGGLGPQSGDPALAFVPPVQQYRESYTVVVPDRYDDNELELVTPAGGMVALDGTDLTLAMHSFASGMWTAGTITIPPGAHTITCPMGCCVEVAGWSGAVSYLYSGGLDLQTIVE